MADIAAVIPAYNAESTLGGVLRTVRSFVPNLVVVDDGSRDGTSRCAREAGARLFSHPRNRGKGAALRTAFEKLASEPLDAVITLDADGQHDPGDIPRFLEAFLATRADLIIGSRSAAFDGMSAGRRFGNRFSSRALAFFSGLRLPDSQSGYRLYSIPFLRGTRIRSDFYDAEMELLLQAAESGARVQTVEVRSAAPDGRNGSHFRPWIDTYRICRCVVGFSLRRAVRRPKS